MLASMHRIAVALGTLSLVLASPAHGECVPAPEMATYQNATFADYAIGRSRSDRIGRVVAPVSVNGQGPFRFIVDTGANRSALAVTLSDQLGLAEVARADVNTVHGVINAPLVRVASLQYGGIALNAADLPLLEGPVLAGEHGLLGVDGMSGRRLRLDFQRNCIEISSAESALRGRGWATVRGQLRFGHLVVTRARVRGMNVNLLIDTGSDSSLANLAFRDAIAARARRAADGTIAYTPGAPVVLDAFVHIPLLTIGPVEVRRVNAFIGDFHIFNVWQLRDQPTLLVGMDVLSQTREMAIDYRRASIHFRLREPIGAAVRVNR